jgi:hypothetical protein
MDQPHVIRLRDPWERSRLADGDLLQRWFHKPTGLDATSRVHLVIAGALPRRVFLNEHPLAPASPGVYEITSLLEVRNRLAIELPEDAPEVQVRLEIW